MVMIQQKLENDFDIGILSLAGHMHLIK